MKSICGKAFTFFFVLVIATLLMCQATREDVSMQGIYEIDYNGPQTHALPPVAKGSVPDHSGVKNIGKQKKPVHAVYTLQEPHGTQKCEQKVISSTNRG